MSTPAKAMRGAHGTGADSEIATPSLGESMKSTVPVVRSKSGASLDLLIFTRQAASQSSGCRLASTNLSADQQMADNRNLDSSVVSRVTVVTPFSRRE